MPTSALLLALAAAVGHALWNLLLARARDVEAATALALLVGVALFALPAGLTWEAEASVWPYVVASSLFELAYIALLAAAYRGSELSLVYPLARGLAPVVVLAGGAVALGAATSSGQAAGVVLVAAGVLLVGGLRGADLRGAAFGVAIAVMIAGYTLVDDRGVERASPLAYLELVMIGPALVYAGAFVALRGLAPLRAEANVSVLAAGALILLPFALFLGALELAPAAPVAAVRETSIVLATALGALVLGERVSPARWLGAVVVAGGVALVSSA